MSRRRTPPGRRHEQTGICRACGGAVRFARWADSGRWVVLDAHPVEGGTIEVFQGHATLLPRPGLFHRMHQATCRANQEPA